MFFVKTKYELWRARYAVKSTLILERIQQTMRSLLRDTKHSVPPQPHPVRTSRWTWRASSFTWRSPKWMQSSVSLDPDAYSNFLEISLSQFFQPFFFLRLSFFSLHKTFLDRRLLLLDKIRRSATYDFLCFYDQ